MTTMRGLELARALQAVLGLPPGLDKIVIECDVRAPVRIFVRGYADAGSLPAIVTAVREVTVRDDATVEFTPLDAPHVVGGT